MSFVEINTNDTAVRELRRAYYAVTTFMDQQLGVVLDEVRALELDPIITFIGDLQRDSNSKSPDPAPGLLTRRL